MTRTRACIGMTFVLAIPMLAQHGQGGGVGRVAGSVPGAATGAVNGAISAPAGKQGNGPSNNGNDKNPGTNGASGLGTSSDVSQRVSQNPGLSAQLQTLLPAGTTLAGDASGFRNQGQFVAALHAAHNLNIPFDQLKAKLTGSNPVSLGKAIEGLRPDLDANAVKSNTKLADRQAERDLEQSESAGKPAPFLGRIESNPALASRLQALLPQGSTLQVASAGFKSQGQFIATLEAAKTLSLSFADLKDRVTGGQSLGQAIRALKPNLSEETSDSAAIQAEQRAKVLGTASAVSRP